MYIAHFSSKNLEIQQVKEHLNNVSECAFKIAEKIMLSNTAKLLGKTHDIGKYNDEFQKYISDAMQATKEGVYESWKKGVATVDHGVYGAKYLFETYYKGNWYEKATAEIVSLIVCYHHGGLPDYLKDDCRIPFLERLDKVDKIQFKKVMSRYFEDTDNCDFDIIFKKSTQEIEQIFKSISDKGLAKSKTFIMHLIIKMLYSLLIDADRLDSYCFEVKSNYREYIENEYDWEKYVMKFNNSYAALINLKRKSKSEENINIARKDISEQCNDFSRCNTGIYTLTVPTGGGKTLSSLRFALNHANLSKKDRIIYVIPYTTIIEQNANEVRKFLDCDSDLLEYHSNVFEDNVDEDYKLLTARWDNKIIFTTMVQYLNTIYGKGNQDIRRFHNLANSILIFDEIQMLPIKCMDLFNDGINFLSKVCNSTIVLCSATQPSLSETEKPIMFSKNKEIIVGVEEQFQKLKRVNAIDRTLKSGYSYEDVGKFIVKLRKEHNSILIILNTVKSAECVLAELEKYKLEETSLVLLTTRLCPMHRKDVIYKLKETLRDRKPCICVSTQLIEAGVDISFDVTIRSLAGLDSIAQAAGRGNRNGEKLISESYIINIQEENISRLPEIRLGAQFSKQVLNEISKEPIESRSDLLDPSIMNTYYRKYYNDDEVKNKMNYPLPDKKSNLYDILCTKKSQILSYFQITGEKYPLNFTYQFEKAKKNFNVIEQNTKTVIVPYGEGINIISKMLSSNSIKEKNACIKELQKYTVNVYEHIFNKLVSEGALLYGEMEGMYFLSDLFYDEKKGLNVDKNMQLLNF